jgi:hypothetical protein
MGGFIDNNGPFQTCAQKQTGDIHFAAISLLKKPGQA